MKIKTIVSGILLLFVGISVIYLVADESQSRQTAEELSVQPPLAIPSEKNTMDDKPDGGEIAERQLVTAPNDDSDSQAAEAEHTVIAYYFHGTKRCVTCQTIEAQTEEALKGGFSRELDTGLLKWQPVNVDTPDNRHFVADFQLTSQSVVLVDIENGQQRQWKNLSQVWQLVRNKEAFISYIREETGKYLAGNYE